MLLTRLILLVIKPILLLVKLKLLLNEPILLLVRLILLLNKLILLLIRLILLLNKLILLPVRLILLLNKLILLLVRRISNRKSPNQFCNSEIFQEKNLKIFDNPGNLKNFKIQKKTNKNNESGTFSYFKR